MPETSNKNIIKKDKIDSSPVEKKEIIEKFFAFESKKLEIEKLRSLNESKELEISAQSSAEATKLAEKDLENQKIFFNRDFDFKNKVLSRLFILAIIGIIVFASITIFLSMNNASILEKLIAFGFDLIKYAIGALLGYYFKASIKSKDKSND